MATQAEKLIRIASPTGASMTVTEADYKHKKMVGLGGQTYEDAGYTVVSYEDGTAYEDGAEPTKYALASMAGEIGGEGATNHTNIDGGSLTDAQLADAGVAVSAPAERRSARRTHESATTLPGNAEAAPAS